MTTRQALTHNQGLAIERQEDSCHISLHKTWGAGAGVESHLLGLVPVCTSKAWGSVFWQNPSSV